MFKLYKRSRTNPLQPQSVNPRQGTISPRQSSYAQPSGSWLGRHKTIIICLSVLTLLTLLASVSYLVINKWLIVDHIHVSQQVNVQPTVVTLDQVAQMVNQHKGRSLFLLNDQQLSQQILEQLPGVAKVDITKQYPTTLIIDYIPQIALAQLNSPQATFLVNRQGYIFAQQQSPNLPQIITSDRQVKVGQTISAQGLELALKLIEGLRQTSPKIKTITLSDHQLELEMEQNPKILIGQLQSPERMIIVIKDLLGQAEQQQKIPKLIDLRFDRPVLQY